MYLFIFVSFYLCIFVSLHLCIFVSLYVSLTPNFPDVEKEDNCNTKTGQCLKCIGYTAGRYCEECARGYYGDAIDAKNCTSK